MRQIAGAFAELEKARLVGKLRHARERIRKERGKCEGRKPHVEIHPEAVAMAKRLHRASPKGGRLSLRRISAELAAAGFLNERDRPYHPNSIKSMVEGARPVSVERRRPVSLISFDLCAHYARERARWACTRRRSSLHTRRGLPISCVDVSTR